jgi:hypothetical protein
MENPTTERLLIVASRLADQYELTESGVKHLQHVFTTWFPRMVYFDLTGDTVRVNVLVRRGIVSNKSVFGTSFLRADDSVIKRVDYDEDRLIGKACPYYDQSSSKYVGKIDGFDCRNVYYLATAITPANRPL